MDLHTITGPECDSLNHSVFSTYSTKCDGPRKFLKCMDGGKCFAETNIINADIHANHLEGQNAATRRKISTYRRKTNTYAKSKNGLPRVLDCYWVFHNFVKKHFTTKEVPAVKIGVINAPFSWRSIFEIQMAF